MKPNTRIAIAGLLSAAGAVLTSLAAEFNGGGAQPDNTPDPATPAEPPAAKRGRKPAAEKAAVEEKPAEPETPAEPEAETEAVQGKTYEELKAIIEPHVKEGRGEDVKKIIRKHDPTGNPPSIKTMPAKNHAEFEKDIQALGY